MNNEEHFRKLERMYLGAPVNEYYAPTIRISRGEAQMDIRVRPDFFHAAGAVHGVVYFKLLDEVFVLTVSYNVYFTRPVSKGVMSAKSKVVQSSERLLIAESVILDSDGNKVGRGSGMFMRSNIPLTEDIGYK
jgi:uncharacterized protein (TIGR00369 family)